MGHRTILARRARESSNQAYILIVVVSGDVQERLVARTLLNPVELPIGVVTSFIGAFLFIVIFYRSRRARV